MTALGDSGNIFNQIVILMIKIFLLNFFFCQISVLKISKFWSNHHINI